MEVRDLDWAAVRKAVDAPAIRARMSAIVERMETVLDRARGPGLLFDADRASATDRAIHVSTMDATSPLWIIGDLHGDLLALEASLAQIERHAGESGDAPPRIVFMGDLVDDEGFGLELLLRVFELILDWPGRVCVVAGNHDEGLTYSFPTGCSWRTAASRWPTCTRRSKKAGTGTLLRVCRTSSGRDRTRAPAGRCRIAFRAAASSATRTLPSSARSAPEWDDRSPTWRAAMTTRKSGTRFPRPTTTVALSRRLPRERFGAYERAPTLARVVAACVPQVYQLFPPAELINEIFPQPSDEAVDTLS